MANPTFELTAGPKTDYFVDGHTGHEAHNSVSRLEAVDYDFTACVFVRPEFQATYDAGALFVYQDNSHWIKVAFELTDLGYPSVVTVVTDGLSDDANGESIAQDGIWLRISRKGTYWSAHYSADGNQWKMIRYFPLALDANIQVGVTAQSPTGEGCTVRFEGYEVVPNRFENLRMGV